MPVTVQITTPAAGAQLTPGGQTVSALVSGIDYGAIIRVHCLIRRAGEMPEGVPYGDSNLSFLSCNNPSAQPLVFASAGWVPCPMPPPGQTWQVEVKSWVEYRKADVTHLVSCSVSTPMPPMP